MEELFDDDIDIFFGDPDDQDFRNPADDTNRIQENIRKPSLSIPHSLDENIKTFNTKNKTDKLRTNKYVEKLKEYEVPPENLNSREVDEGVSLNELGKKERNKLAAKQSRDRKKLYIELMER